MTRNRNSITVLAFLDRIALFHTLMPHYAGLVRRGFEDRRLEPPRVTVTGNPQWCLTRDRNRVLIMERMFLKPPESDLVLMERLRGRYDRIIFLNGNAGGGIHRPEVLPFVDRFYNKAVFSDPGVYTRPLYGTELFTDYNHRVFGVDDGAEAWNRPAVPEAELPKIRNHWNIGVGAFPRRHFPQRVGAALARGGAPWTVPLLYAQESSLTVPAAELPESDYLYDVNMRIGRPGYPTIVFHREHLGTIMRAAAETNRWRLATDKVPIKRFFYDLKRSRITFSPFGWGELCFRDFEAVRAGSLLLKPDMGHLRTYPDIFVPYETYVPVAWDGSDLEEKTARYLENTAERRRIVTNAAARLQREFNDLPRRSAAVFADALGLDFPKEDLP